jgi:hypothetical protein
MGYHAPNPSNCHPERVRAADESKDLRFPFWLRPLTAKVRQSAADSPLRYPYPKPLSKEKNKLYYGDNLEVLQRYVNDESVDLVYLDPPFNSRQNYNVLFAEKDGSQSSSQIHAFEDTWEWNQESMRAYEQIVLALNRCPEEVRTICSRN